MNTQAKTILTILMFAGALTAFDKFSDESVAIGYGYDHITPPQVKIQDIKTTDKNPALRGEYLHGPVTSIQVAIFNSSGASVWQGNATSITNQNAVTGTWQTWEIADNTISTLPIGIYEVTATVTDIASNVASDETRSELQIINDFSKLSVSIEDEDESVKKTSERELTMKLEDYGEATHYMLSEKSNFKGASWKTIDDSISIDLDSEAKQYKFYLKLKDASGATSEIIKKRVTYQPLRQISVSAKNVSRGALMTQRGKRFSKNSTVLVYFSKTSGGYYSPVEVSTSPKGSFSIDYVANKPAGKYSWYAVDQKTNKKSKVSKYTIK